MQKDKKQAFTTYKFHELTIFGCMKGVDGWYRVAFDEQTKTIIPLEKIEDEKDRRNLRRAIQNVSQEQ